MGDVLNMLQVILQQNYSQLNNQYYKQNVGLAVAAPKSTIVVKIYLQCFECNQLHSINKISNYRLL